MAERDEKAKASEKEVASKPSDKEAAEQIIVQGSTINSETVPGGVYMVGGEYVNANGELVEVAPFEAPTPSKEA